MAYMINNNERMKYMDIVDSKELIETLIADNQILLAYFANETCGVCTDMRPKVEEILERYPRIKAIDIDVENSLQLSVGYNIFTIPAVILFVEGKETIREARHISMVQLEDKISRLYDLVFE